MLLGAENLKFVRMAHAVITVQKCPVPVKPLAIIEGCSDIGMLGAEEMGIGRNHQVGHLNRKM